MGVARQETDDETDGELSQQNAIRISHSLPDLQSEPMTHEYIQEQKDIKKVIHNFFTLFRYLTFYCFN